MKSKWVWFAAGFAVSSLVGRAIVAWAKRMQTAANGGVPYIP